MKDQALRWGPLGVLALVFPFVTSPLLLRSATLAAITAIAAIGLNVLMGVAHQFSAGHAAFIAAGAYGVAYLTVDLGLPYVLALPLAVLISGAIGLAFAPVAFKLRHLGLALATFGLIFVVQHVLRNVPALGGGLRPKSMPDVQLFGIDFGVPTGLFGIPLSRTMHYYFLSVALLVLTAVFTTNVLRSRHGRSMSAMGNLDTEDLVAHMGTSVRWTKTKVFVYASMLAGLAGGLLAPFTRILQYESFGIALSVEYIAIIIIGGLGSVRGSLLGAIFVVSLRDVIRVVAPAVPFIAEEGATTGLTIAQSATITYGALIVLLLVFQPGGLDAIWERLRHMRRQRTSDRRDRPRQPLAG